ncbi:uncharacterized protein LOC105779034 [Gossypium raimondii]|uniref:uncharacterized protein LOC105779034 n=1 Tax=Gossypium raimondii TaxID=29730 RepID=UPI00063A95B5|nr:uncharacterized protein LOC105779034 [Gossypium raimondii]
MPHNSNPATDMGRGVTVTIPCLIGSLSVEKALADLRASINVMPYKMFKQLGLEKPKPIRMNIQLVDRSIRYPRGIIDNVLVKVDKSIFPFDFVILDINEDIEVPMILGQPFLATAKIVIDVGSGELVLSVGDENVTLQARDFVRVPSERDDTHYSISVSNHVAQHSFEEFTNEYLFE